MEGTIVDKKGTPVLVDGKKVTVSQTFSPSFQNGSVTMTFTLDVIRFSTDKVIAERLDIDFVILLADRERVIYNEIITPEVNCQLIIRRILMNHYHISVCDDEIDSLQKHKDYLTRLSSEISADFIISYFTDGSQLIRNFSSDTDLLILDVQMDRMDGIETARILRCNHPDLIFFFISNLKDRAIDGYDVHAFQYLAKPVSYPVFASRMKEALQIIDRKRGESILVRTGNTSLSVNYQDILYFEACHGGVQMHMGKETIPVSSSLQDMEKLCLHIPFFRIHAGYLVNLRYIRLIDTADVFLLNGERLPVSRHRKKELLQKMTDYLGNLI